MTTGSPHETLYWRLGKQNAIRHGDWKLVQYDLNVESSPTKEVSQKKLYHLTKDIGESVDLAAQYPEKVKELATLWQSWDRQLAKPLW
jgi:arylsulfatase A-like enzyme